MDSTNPKISTSPSGFPKGGEVYDMLMSKIEPELMRATVHGLKEKYKNETKEEAAARGQRYKKAFAEYDRQFAEYMVQLKTQVSAYQHTALRSAERHDRGKEEEEMKSLEASMSAL